MIVTIVHIWVKPEHIEDFIAATKANHAGSIQEPGNVRFDFLQEADDPGKFTLYEVFETEEDVLAHKQTPHYHRWREAVDGWMARSREGVRHQLIAPLSPDLW